MRLPQHPLLLRLLLPRQLLLSALQLRRILRRRHRAIPVSGGSTSLARIPPRLAPLQHRTPPRDAARARTTGLRSSPSALPSRSPVSRCLPLAYPAAPSRPQWLTLLSAPRPRLRPPVSPQAPIAAPTPAITPTPTQASPSVATAQQPAASTPQQGTRTESTPDSSLRRRSRQASEAQPVADAQPAFPSRRSQRQAVRDAHVPQPIPAPEEAPAAQQAPVPMPEPPVPPVALPPPQAPSMLPRQC